MTYRTTTLHKVLALLVYLSLALGGIIALLEPPASMTQTTAHLFVVMWGGLMTGGGLAGCYSAVSGNILPELVGLPALIGALLIFLGALALRLPGLASKGGSLVLMCVLLAFGLLLALRAFELRGLVKAAESRR